MISRQCLFILLVQKKVGWRQGTTLGIHEMQVVRSAPFDNTLLISEAHLNNIRTFSSYVT